MTAPDVSIILAVRNEAATLKACLESLRHQDYPNIKQIVIAVAPSTDQTKQIIEEQAALDPRVIAVDNTGLFAPHGLNAALKFASAQYVVRADGHSEFDSNYVSQVVQVLESTGAANVGGRMIPRGDTPISTAIARALTSRFGIGGAAFHVGGNSGPQPTVYLGAFRREVLKEVGGYDEYFIRAQDWELNHRIRQAGYTVWFDPEISVDYVPRNSWRDYAKQQFRTGGWRRRVMERHRETISLRYLAPPALVSVLVSGTAAAVAGVVGKSRLGWLGLVLPAYVGGATVIGLAEGKELPWSARRRVPVALVTMHVSWGLGFWRRAK